MNQECRTIQGMLDEALDSPEDGALDGRALDHLATCRECRELYGRLRQLNEGLGELARSAERISEGISVSSVSRRWRPLAWAAAAAIALAGTWVGLYEGPFVSVDMPRQLVEAEPQGQKPSEVEVVAETETALMTIDLRDMPSRIAVPVESTNPRVHIVWLFEDSGPGPQERSSVEPPAEQVCTLDRSASEDRRPCG